MQAGSLGELFDAPLDCILSDITVVQPDILFVATHDASRVSDRAIEGAPTLATASPTTHRREARTGGRRREARRSPRR